MAKFAATVIATMVFTIVCAAQASADVIINDWANSFAGFDTTSGSGSFTDPGNGASTTMTVTLSAGDGLSWASHLGIDGGTGGDIDPGEAMTFQWDQPIVLKEISLFRGGDDEELLVSSAAFADFVALGGFSGSLSVPASTPVLLTGGDGTNGGSPAKYKVNGTNGITVTFAIVPEPASIALVGLGGLALVARRRAVK